MCRCDIALSGCKAIKFWLLSLGSNPGTCRLTVGALPTELLRECVGVTCLANVQRRLSFGSSTWGSDQGTCG